MDNDSQTPSTESLLDLIQYDFQIIRGLQERMDDIAKRLEALEARPQDNISMAIESLRAERDRIVATPGEGAAVPRTAPEQTGRIQEQVDTGWLTGGQRTRTLEGGRGHCGKSYHKPERARDDDPGTGAYMMGSKAP